MRSHHAPPPPPLLLRVFTTQNFPKICIVSNTEEDNCRCMKNSSKVCINCKDWFAFLKKIVFCRKVKWPIFVSSFLFLFLYKYFEFSVSFCCCLCVNLKGQCHEIFDCYFLAQKTLYEQAKTVSRTFFVFGVLMSYMLYVRCCMLDVVC